MNDVPDIELSSSTGDIKATIQGKRKDYQIDTKTMGNKTQENEGASKKVKAHSSTGNVNVQFSDSSIEKEALGPLFCLPDSALFWLG